MTTDTNNPAPIAEPASEPIETVPWPTVTRYSGGASHDGIGGRVWIRMGDGPEEVEYVPAAPAPAVDERTANSDSVDLAAASNGSPNNTWVPVTERMPASGVTVLACYTNSAGNVRRIRAEWTAAKTIESDAESEIGEYDEATDCFYDPEGWYEKIDNWLDYSSVAVVNGEVTHWMPLPAPPRFRLKQTTK